MFSSIAGRLALAGLCSVVLQDGWPRLACVLWFCRTAGSCGLVFGSIAGRLALAGLCSVYCRTAGLGWLVFSSIAGRLA